MGHGGRRFFLRGIIYYAVSPFQLKILSSVHPMNMVRRVYEEIPYVVPSPLLGWFIYTVTDRAHHKTLLKKPGDFDDEDDALVCVESNLIGGEEDENCAPNTEEENNGNEDGQK